MQRIALSGAVAAAIVVFAASARTSADTVGVQHREAPAHGFLTLRSMDGRLLARGEQAQTVQGNHITKRLTFRFDDGSVDDETTEFADAGTLRLITYHHLQKGPSFPHPLELTIDAPAGHVTVRDLADARPNRVESKTLTLPTDLSNGLVTNIVKNVDPAALPLSVSYLAATPKLRLVRLVITSGGLDSFGSGAAARQARHYVVDVRLGGLGGIVTTAIRKTLPRSHIWISAGPAFLRAESALGVDGPTWQIDLAGAAAQTN